MNIKKIINKFKINHSFKLPLQGSVFKSQVQCSVDGLAVSSHCSQGVEIHHHLVGRHSLNRYSTTSYVESKLG